MKNSNTYSISKKRGVSLFLLFPLLGLLLSSCSRGPHFDEERSFAGDAWNRFSPETFDISVDNIDNYYNIDLAVTIDTVRFRYESLPVMFILNGPTGEQRQFYGTVLFKEKGRWRGEQVDDTPLRVATGRIRSFFSFNTKGNYTLHVSQATSQYDLEGVHSIALTITRAKVDYDL